MRLKGKKMEVPDILDPTTLCRTYYFLNEIEEGDVISGVIVVERRRVVGWGIPIHGGGEAIKYLTDESADLLSPMTCEDFKWVRRLVVEAFHDTML